MPKEVIREPNPRGYENNPLELGLELGWGEGSVQVCTKNYAVPEYADEPVGDGSSYIPGKPYGSGWAVSLERHQINDLIRHLRRARDHAFGVDA